MLGVPFPAVVADVSSAYPLVAHHIGWWELLSAQDLCRQGVIAELAQACQQVVGDPAMCLRPELWRTFGATLVEVVPDGEPFPVALEDDHRPDDRMVVAPLYSSDRGFWYAWPDVLAAAVLARRAPHVLSAVRLEPEGSQPRRRRRLAVLPGLVADLGSGPSMAFVRRRARAKRAGDDLLAAELRVVVNALVFGGFARFDEVVARRGRQRVVAERPGPWNFLPISASVTAGARLLLAVLDRLISDVGGTVAYRDTDSGLVLASPEGGPVVLADGSVVHALSWAEVDRVLAAFDVLSPAPAWPVWRVERGTRRDPLHAVVFGAKRHVEWAGAGPLVREAGTEEGDGSHFDATEANLGGTYSDPPGLRGRLAPLNGYRRWSMAAVRREADRARRLVGQAGAPAPWDGEDDPFPAVQRFIVKTPEVARSLPSGLGARPGTRYLEVRTTPAFGDRVLVALDPGGDLTNWQDLRFFDKATGAAVAVTTRLDNYDDARLVTLDEKASTWSKPRPAEAVTEVRVDPRRVRYKGRVSGVVDALADEGASADVSARRPTYGRACDCGCGAQLVGGRRHRRFVDATHAKRAARARRRERESR